ncbi:MAG: MBOAT family O-acyltransferase [Cardiobacteriaceae bacterium]|nr:MBOAT family O-acyltransferase [Cardiobacteriaceae bacterium]
MPIYWACSTSVRTQNTLLLLLSLGLLYYVKPSALWSVLGYSIFIATLDNFLSDDVDEEERQSALPQKLLTIGIIGSLLFLASMKYFDDYAPILRTLGLIETLDLVMPLGLSYYTFQAISYLIERYRGNLQPLPYPELLLYFSFFPTITAGPIARAHTFKSALGEQQGMYSLLTEERELSQPTKGIVLILLGLLKAWVLSAWVASAWVRPVFENPMDFSAFQQLSAWYGYTFQLYFDFSGYSDLVCGLALLLGFSLPTNFHSPLNARNIQDFWSRWHISLSTWIRDYIYIPLGGSRHGFTRTQINLIIAFTLSGIWHGSSVNFMLWGLLHGLALIIFNIWRKSLPTQSTLPAPLASFMAWFLTFHFVVLSFVIFRTHHWQDLIHLIKALWQSDKPNLLEDLAPIIVLLVYLALNPIRQSLRQKLPLWWSYLPTWLWFLPLSLAFTLLILLAPEGIPEFIYANF